MIKPVLIFLHGGPGFKDYLAPYFQELELNFNIIFYDQLQGSDIRMDDLILQLDQIVDSESGSKILIGHSWGGVLAAEYATRFENKLSGLVIMNTGLNFQHWNDEFKKEKERLGLTEAPPEEIFLTADEREVGKPFLDLTWESFSGETFDRLYESYIKTFDLSSKIKNMKLPVLNIYGEKDVRFPAAVARSLGLKSVCIEKAGHFPFLLPDTRKLVLKAINEFVN